MKNDLIAIGKVVSLSISGNACSSVSYNLAGPLHDIHQGLTRKISSHDNVYMSTSSLKKGDEVFNWRTWTALSVEELSDIENELGHRIDFGMLLENIVIEGIPKFSQLLPTTRLVFQASEKGTELAKGVSSFAKRPILAVWEENGPCKTVGKRLEEHHKKEGLAAEFVKVAQRRRGLMGFVLSAGLLQCGDTVLVYPPVE